MDSRKATELLIKANSKLKGASNLLVVQKQNIKYFIGRKPVNEFEIGENLTLKQDLFCRLYTGHEEFFGNGTLSYAEAYGFDLDSADTARDRDEYGNSIVGTSDYDRMVQNCASAGSRLLRNVKISTHLRKMYNELLRDDVVDAELTRVILQTKELSSKMSAIREYNSLKNRVTKKIDITGMGAQINLSEKDQAMLKKLLKQTDDESESTPESN